mmetsp:Transcript_127445/g.271734  ORF Transcript_127445/g.271734 Transcript_127445/m.271734 type:complete len:314 (+) Transcript_127445:66-1007(+)
MPDLTLEQAIELQDKLITGYFTPEFQEALWSSTEQCNPTDELAKGRARQEACYPVQTKYLPDYGFEASKKGVQDSVTAFNPHQSNGDVVLRNNIMTYLVTPEQQKMCAEGRAKPPIGIPPSVVSLPDPRERDSESSQGTGHVWKVTGGKEKGGIIVKGGADVKSEEMARRLTTGCLVEEIERIEDRLKYQKIEGTGGGPDIGWVSIAFKGKPLVEPLWFTPSDDWMPKEKDTYKVIFDPRVAKRAKPSKDGAMVGGLKKGEKVKGEVVTIDGVPWLKGKEMIPGKMGDYDDFYVMIDGSSLGLGKLLEKVEAK